MDDDEITPVTKSEEEGDEIKKQELPTSVRGAPEHMKAVIRKKQNSESAKRSRKRRKEKYRKVFEKFHEQTQQITALEKRVSTLVSILHEAGVSLPGNLEGSLVQNVDAARAAVLETAGGSATHGALNDSPDDEELFQEMMRILGDDDDE